MLKIKVILPAYNEEQTIGDTIRAFNKALPEADIVVVDNNSSDKTSQIAKEVFANEAISGHVIFEPNQGKGAAIRRAFAFENADVYLMADADMTYPAEAARSLIDRVVNDGIDMVVGDRLTSGGYFVENKRPLHNFGNKLVLGAINRLFSAKITDAMSGYRAFSRRFVETYPVMVRGFELETDLTLHALDKRLSIAQVPIDYKDRPEGSHSKLNTVQDGIKVLTVIFNILRLYKPLNFFGVVFVVLALLSISSAIPAVTDYFTTGQVFHLPSAVLAVGLAVASLLSAAVGLILDSAAITNRREFELRLLSFMKADQGDKAKG